LGNDIIKTVIFIIAVEIEGIKIMEKNDFNKRIKMVQNECFKSLSKEDLSKTSNSKSGYYSLESIFKYLNPLLEKYELNIEIMEISQISVHMIWYDDLSDKTRDCIISIEKIKDVPRLASIPNDVQSYGAILTYVKRYAYCCILRLPSTDVIEKNYPQQLPPQKKNLNNQPKSQETKPNQALANQTDLRRFYAVFGKKFTKEYIDNEIAELVKKAFKVKSKKEIPRLELIKMIQYAEKAKPDEIEKALKDKAKK
jgi:hypothetical protein